MSYKHSDGTPKWTLPWLEKFNKDFSTRRRNDAPYKFAQLLRSSVRDGEEFGLDMDEYTGWGVYPSRDMSADYEYTLLKDGRVIVN